MEYSGFSGVTGKEPPTYACVGTNDGIAPYRTMWNRINRIKANGTDAEIEIFRGLSHGFDLVRELLPKDGLIMRSISGRGEFEIRLA